MAAKSNNFGTCPKPHELLPCGCRIEAHPPGPCPARYQGGPPKYRINAIAMVTMIHNGVLHMRIGQQWMPLTTEKHYADLNRFLDEYCAEYVASRDVRPVDH